MGTGQHTFGDFPGSGGATIGASLVLVEVAKTVALWASEQSIATGRFNHQPVCCRFAEFWQERKKEERENSPRSPVELAGSH